MTGTYAPLNRLGTPACTVDRNHRIVNWNDAAVDFFRVTAAGAVGREWHTVVRSVNSDDCCPLCRTRRALRAGEVAMPSECTVSIDGYHERVVMVPMPADDDGINFVIITPGQLNGEVAPIRINSRVRQLSDERMIDELTPREREVLACVVEGLDARSIASAVGITHATARNYVQRILSKLGVRNKAEAVSIALTYNLLAS
jgi:DNA-binding CsgD family transcriptional regulator